MLKKAADSIRRTLRRHQIWYAFIGGIGVVLFWRGVWHSADFFAATFMYSRDTVTSIDWVQGLDSFVSLVIGTLLLLATGLFVSELASGQALSEEIKEEEKVTQKESAEIPHIEREIHHVTRELEELEKDIHHNHNKKKPRG